jgi:hypothetical protein
MADWDGGTGPLSHFFRLGRGDRHHVHTNKKRSVPLLPLK